MTEASATRPWEAPDLFPLKPADSPYGYLRRRIPVPSTLDDLQNYVGRGSTSAPLVWTPESPRIMPAEESASLFDAVKQRLLKKQIFLAVRWGFLGAAAAGFILLSARWDKTPIADVKQLAEMIFVFLGVIPTWLAVSNFRVLKTFQVRDMIAYGRAARYEAWLKRHHRAMTWLIAACILIVAACQFRIGIDSSIDAAGLVKPLPAGQWWRILTSALMHTGLIHLGVNFCSLLVLGRWFEAHARRAFLPVVFVLSALAGNWASLRFGPPGSSVGASGGLLGMIGFLAVLGYRRRAQLPNGFFKTIVFNLIIVGAMGADAPNVIDNAAHIGGLCAGIFIGLVALNKSPLAFRGSVVTVASAAACVILIATGAKAVSVLSQPPIPPPEQITPDTFDTTKHYQAIYRNLAGEFEIDHSSSDSTAGSLVETIHCTFLQPEIYSFRFDEYDDAGAVFQTRWVRVRVAAGVPPTLILITPDDSTWPQYNEGEIDTSPTRPGIVRWGELWKLAGIGYSPQAGK